MRERERDGKERRRRRERGEWGGRRRIARTSSTTEGRSNPCLQRPINAKEKRGKQEGKSGGKESRKRGERGVKEREIEGGLRGD